jgi:phospholipid/cholesterol/gamma-HCH transport system permease protein
VPVQQNAANVAAVATPDRKRAAPVRVPAALAAFLAKGADAIEFLGQIPLSTAALLAARRRFPLRDFIRVTMQCSAEALLIVLVVNVLVGSILAFVGAVQLVKFGAGIYVADLVGIAVSREMAAVMTAVVMAGRTGASFAAELATMQTNEEIDALSVLGLDTVAYLALPRVLALTLVMPLLYLYGCAAGLLGGLLVASGMMNLAPSAYLDRTVEALNATQFILGASKSLSFGFLVAMTACWYGLHADRSAAGVGQATTGAVVAGIVGVIALDAVFAVCANALGW